RSGYCCSSVTTWVTPAGELSCWNDGPPRRQPSSRSLQTSIPTKTSSMTGASESDEDRRRPPLSCGLPVDAVSVEQEPGDCSAFAVHEEPRCGDQGSPTIWLTRGVTVCRTGCFMVRCP